MDIWRLKKIKLIVWISMMVSVLPCSAEEGSVLKNLTEVRSLTVEEADRKPAVRLKAQVVKVQPNPRGGLYIFDGEEGCYIRFKPKNEKLHEKRLKLKMGDHILLTGFATKGYFAPDITVKDFKFIQHGELPQPKKSTLAEFIKPDVDCQWMAFDGVLSNFRASQRMGQLIAEVVCEGRLFNVVLPETEGTVKRLKELQYRDITIHALAVTHFTKDRQFVSRYFQVSSIDHFSLGEPPVSPLTTVQQVFSCDTVPLQLYRIQGVLTHNDGRVFYLRGNKGCLVVRLLEEMELPLGAVLEVQGRVQTSHFGPRLYASEVKVVKELGAPKPLKLEVLKDRVDVTFHAELVSLDKVTLLDVMEKDELTVLTCQHKGVRFEAYLGSQYTANLNLQKGCELSLTGICELLGKDDEVLHQHDSNSFFMTLRDANDVVVIETASWWTLERAILCLGGISILALVILVWTILLRWRVSQQTETIKTQVENGAVLEERQRMARELHDTFQQNMTGVAMQMSTLREQISEEDKDSKETLGLARRMLDYCRFEAQEAITELRSAGVTRASLATLIDESLLKQAESAGIRLEIETGGTPYNLSARVSHHLLRMTSEALTNAIRHAQPDSIVVFFDYGVDGIKITVKDDGCGFDCKLAAPVGHFGLLGFKERAGKIGANVHFESYEEQGTLVSIELSRKLAE